MVSYVGFKAAEMGFDAHLTVCYFGNRNKRSRVVKEIHEIIDDSRWRWAWVACRDKIDMFGPDRNIPVLRVDVEEELHDLRTELLPYSVSNFVEWNPHITLDLRPERTIRLPKYIGLTNLGVY